MENTLPTFAEPATESEYQAIITELFAQFRQLNLAICANQKEIDRLKADSHKLHKETQEIKARTQANLDTLAAMVLQ